jgi:hypothetical protein
VYDKLADPAGGAKKEKVKGDKQQVRVLIITDSVKYLYHFTVR